MLGTLYIADNIKTYKKGPPQNLRIWNGPPEQVDEVREILYRYWRQTDDAKWSDPVPPLFNMHENEMCVDVRFITTDPERWSERRESALSRHSGGVKDVEEEEVDSNPFTI